MLQPSAIDERNARRQSGKGDRTGNNPPLKNVHIDSSPISHSVHDAITKCEWNISTGWDRHDTMKGGAEMFAQKIRELRLSRNLSEAALDEIFDLMRGTVANWEHGFSMPEDELIDDIAAYFKIKRSELIGAA